jgi:hypothetical protein
VGSILTDELRRRTEFQVSSLSSLFAPVQDFSLLSVFLRCSIRGLLSSDFLVLSRALRSTPSLTPTDFAVLPFLPDYFARGVSTPVRPFVERRQSCDAIEVIGAKWFTAAYLFAAGDLPSVANFDKSDSFRTIATVYEFGKPIKSAGPSSCAGHSRRVEFWK